MFDKFDNPDCKNWAKQIYDKTLSTPNLFKNKTQKSQAIITFKFKILFFKKIKKSISSKFFILSSICATSYK